MKKVQRIIAMIAAVCILTMSVGNTILVYAVTPEKNESPAIMADNVTINAGTKEINGIIAAKHDIYRMPSAIIATLPEEAAVGESNYNAESKYTISGGTYFKDKVMFSTKDVIVSDTLILKGSMEVYVDTITSDGTTILYTQEGDMVVNASKVDIDGLLYAPNGNITINAGSVDITGTIIANNVTINADNVKITADEELIEYINYICALVSDDYMDIRGALFDTEYTFSVKADKEPDYIDIYVRKDSEGNFHKLTTVDYTEEETTIEVEYKTTIDITMVGYTKYGEKIDSEIETYGKGEYDECVYYKQDTDEDGLSDGTEIWYLGSSPYLADTDGDGFNDYYEVMVLNTEPSLADEDKDFDCDGATNKKEMVKGTNPYLKDTDFDGIPDLSDAEPVKYNSGQEPSEHEYKVVMTKFDMKKAYTDSEGNVYVYITNKLTGQEKALLSNEKNTVIYYNSEGKTAAILREADGTYDINTYGYNDAGKITEISNNGYRYTIEYDEDDAIKTVNLNGEELTVNEKVENEFTEAYNDEEQLVSVTNKNIGYTVGYEYKDGNIIKTTINDKFIIEYNDTDEKYVTDYKLEDEEKHLEITGDEEGNIFINLISSADMEIINGENIKTINIKEAETVITNVYEYENDRVQNIKFNNGKTIEYQYDKSGYISKVTENGTVTKEYEYDSFGKLIKETDCVTGKTTEYTHNYDNITDIRVYENGELTEHKEYKYDEEYTDKLISAGVDKVTYDSKGNISSFKGISYKYENGKMAKSIKDGIATEYTYNESGYRIQKSIDGEVTEYYYENELLIAEKSDSHTIWYIYGADEEKAGFICNGETYYYERNAMGDIINILDSVGTVVVTYTYDVWGNIISVTGDKTLADINPIRYRGYYYDRETGLYNLNTRYYNPEIGRFMSLDEPEAFINSNENYNLYAYCCNNPVNYYDPDGREKVNVRIFAARDNYYGSDGKKNGTVDKYYDDVKAYISSNGGVVSFFVGGSEASFKNYWNNKEWYYIDVLVIFAHGAPENILINGDIVTVADIKTLDEIELDLLIIHSCNAGHDDLRYSNVAAAFLSRMDNESATIGHFANTSMVLASDGTVYFYGDKYSYSVADNGWKDYVKSNRTTSYGWTLLAHRGDELYFYSFLAPYKAKCGEYDKEGKKIIKTHWNVEGIDFSKTIDLLISNYGLEITVPMMIK